VIVDLETEQLVFAVAVVLIVGIVVIVVVAVKPVDFLAYFVGLLLVRY